MKILTADQIREVDRLSAERHGISSLQLMENAATAVVNDIFLQGIPHGAPIAVLCGKGNNGGDGLAVARLLHQRKQEVHVFLVAEPGSLSKDAAAQWSRWQECNAPAAIVRSETDWRAASAQLPQCSLYVDALLGVGLRGPVEGLLKAIIEDVNRIARDVHARVVAVDIPSGLPADAPLASGIAIHAHRTVTFTAPKLGLLVAPNTEYVGKLLVANIGSPLELLPEVPLRWLEPREFGDLPLQRAADSHKGSFGHVLIVGGSRGKSGAAALAAIGSLRAGAGLTTVATAEGSLSLVASFAPEMMTEPLPETDAGTISLRALDYARFEKLQEGKSALAIGPGLGTHPETQEFIRTLVSSTELPVILDADGLNAFAGRPDELALRKTKYLAITPHPGEMARLLGVTTAEVQARRMETAREAAKRWQCTVILKGAGTVIASPEMPAYLNTSGNPWMAVGGSGDVLTGALAACVAQFGVGHWVKALCLGVYCHGLAGDKASALDTRGPVLATDLARRLGDARALVHAEMATSQP